MQPTTPASTPESPGPGRPRVLNDAKRRQICVLVASGCTIADAARTVRCAVSTIHRERKQNKKFRTQLRRAEMRAQMHPLRAMRKAIGTHWRAAGWWLERVAPERFARQNPARFGPKQARALMDDILSLIDDENIHPLQANRLKQRVLAAMEYAMHTTWDSKRSYQSLRKAIDYREKKERSRVQMRTWPDERIVPSSMPVPTIPRDIASAPTTPTKSGLKGVAANLNFDTPNLSKLSAATTSPSP